MISAFVNWKSNDHSAQLPVNIGSYKPFFTQQSVSESQEGNIMLVQESLRSQYKAMFQDRVKSAKILSLQRRFSSCSNLGRQVDSMESSPSITSGQDHKERISHFRQKEFVNTRSSSTAKAPHFVSSLYHSIEQSPGLSSKLGHSLSVETPPRSFSSTRLRSGSCPLVWTPVKFTCQVPLFASTPLNSSHQNSPAPIRAEIIQPIRKNSFSSLEKFHEGSISIEAIKNTVPVTVESKTAARRRTGLSVSFGSTESNLAPEPSKDDKTCFETYSSYEDLNDDDHMTNCGDYSDISPNTPSCDDFDSKFYLKRTVSTECFNTPQGNFILQNGSNSSPCPAGLQNSVRNSFFSNTDIYNLKSPIDQRQKFVKVPSQVVAFSDRANVGKLQDYSSSFRVGKRPNLTKTVSEQYLSSSQKHCVNKPRGLNGSISTSQNISGIDKNSLQKSSKNSVYVSSIFLNLSNSKNVNSQSNVSRVSSASPPVRTNNNQNFSRRPSTLSLNQTCKAAAAAAPNVEKVRLSTPMSPLCKRKLSPNELTVLKAQKESFEKLLAYVKESALQRDKLKAEISQMEISLHRKQDQYNHRPKASSIQELKRNNFVLKSEILRLREYLKIHSHMARGEDSDSDSSLFDFNTTQKWSYNPSYDGWR